MDDAQLSFLPAVIGVPLATGFQLWRAGKLVEAQRQFEAALAQATRSDNRPGRLSAQHLLGNLAFDRGDLGLARALHEAVLAECRALGFMVGVASSLHNLGLVTAREGDLHEARALIAEAIGVYLQIGQPAAATRARHNLRRLNRPACCAARLMRLR